MQDQVRQILSIYCLCDDFLRAWGKKDAPQAKMTTAQVMTVAIVAVTLFDGNQERSRCFLQEHGYIPNMLSKGCFNRRLHEVPDAIWQALFKILADVHKQLNQSQEYAVDSLPVPVCDNITPIKPPHPALSPLPLPEAGQESAGQESAGQESQQTEAG